MTWMVRLRAEDGALLERASYGSSSAAMDAYRLLLGREDLLGQPVAAVFKPPRGVAGTANVGTFFSRFDREVGDGRIAPNDPRLYPYADDATARQVAGTLPPAVAASGTTDWEADPRPLSECLKAWAREVGGRDAAAGLLRVSRKTFDGWCDGRGAGQEAMVRRLMTLAR